MSKGKCAVESCGRDARVRDWCSKHYAKWKRHGDPMGGRPEGPRVCVISDCARPHFCRGWCRGHYRRWVDHGDPCAPLPKRRYTPRPRREPTPLLDRLAAFVDFTTDPAACWPWRGVINKAGYGDFGVRGISAKGAHRLVYIALVGPIPDGLHLDHTCHDPTTCAPGVECPHRRCVNPAHLEPTTPQENSRRSGSMAAQNARKTHCKVGHPLSGDNLVIKGKARYRQCRICMKARNRKYKARVRARPLRDIPN